MLAKWSQSLCVLGDLRLVDFSKLSSDVSRQPHRFKLLTQVHIGLLDVSLEEELLPWVCTLVIGLWQRLSQCVTGNVLGDELDRSIISDWSAIVSDVVQFSIVQFFFGYSNSFINRAATLDGSRRQTFHFFLHQLDPMVRLLRCHDLGLNFLLAIMSDDSRLFNSRHQHVILISQVSGYVHIVLMIFVDFRLINDFKLGTGCSLRAERAQVANLVFLSRLVD